MRYCFVCDDDGHGYLIPVSRRPHFRRLIESEDYDALEKQFGKRRINGYQLFSFEKPKEDVC
jgi:hypothetical protein